MADITMPQLGETVTEGTITQWFKEVGDEVAEDEVLFEVSTDKVDSEVPSTVAGVLTEIRVPEGETVDVGEVLAVIGDAGSAPASDSGADDASAAEDAPEPEPSGASESSSPAPAESEPASPAPAAASAAPSEPAAEPAPSSETAPSETAPSEAASSQSASSEGGDGRGSAGVDQLLSPVVRRLVNQHGIDVSQIQGSGVGGRISRSDVETAIDAQRAPGSNSAQGAAAGSPAQAPTPAAPPAPAAAQAPAPAAAQAPASPPAQAPAASPAQAPVPAPMRGEGDLVVPFTNIRRRTAEHMVMSKSVSPHVITVVEVDYEGVERARSEVKSSFKEEEGFGLTYLPFIARATVDALADYPHLNASVSEEGLIVHRRVNLSVAVDLDFAGLLAPVITSADEARLRGLARSISDIAARARGKQLGPDELSGGTFTLSNSGSFGSFMVAPIINQPQVAIMSTDGVTRKPVVITDGDGNEAIGIHSVGLLTLSWDHRAIDGAYAAAFMRRVKEIIETRDWNAEVS